MVVGDFDTILDGFGARWDETETIDGELVWLKPRQYSAALDRIDQFENVPFLFRRIVVSVEAEGNVLEAWAYTYTHASHTIR